jgi:PhnB protein
MGEVPGAEIAPEHKNRIMHCELRIGGAVLMLADTMPSMPVTAGTNTHVALQFDDDNDLVQKFDALAVGGQVTMPLRDPFFGKFGMLTDAFGVSWMFVGPEKKGA